MRFISEFISSFDGSEPAWWFVFRNHRLLIRERDTVMPIPFLYDPAELNLHPLRRHYLGKLDGSPCFAVQISENTPPPQQMVFKGVRELFGQIEDDLVALAGRADQITRWDEAHQFCGRCGKTMENKPDERAKFCPSCHLVNYPRISPAIIVAVIKEKQLLLAHATRFAANFYSVLAGFVEPGESLEDCVKREVKEETGINIKDVHYFGSQPWPFPDSLMVGFTAVYAGGDIVIDNKEILDANWFSADNLPQVPGKFSIAGQLIDWFVSSQKA